MKIRTISPYVLYILALFGMGTAFLQEHLECAWITFAAIFLVPMGLGVLGMGKRDWHFLPGVLLALAYILHSNEYAIWMAVPYALCTLYWLLQSLRYLYADGNLRLFDVLRTFALGYLFTGSIWALLFLGGFRPFDFTLTIVSLTVAHFHVAGFVLTTAIAGLWQKEQHLGHRSLGIAALLGMPSVAAGITLTQLGFPPFVEWFSGFLFAIMAAGTAYGYWRMANQSTGKLVIYGRIAALSLVFGAILAALYALRFHFPLSFIHIPNMKLLHGTVNTLGFGWCCLKMVEK
jgi:hypothetical protein